MPRFLTRLACWYFGHKWRKERGKPLLYCEWCGKTSDIWRELG